MEYIHIIYFIHNNYLHRNVPFISINKDFHQYLYICIIDVSVLYYNSGRDLLVRQKSMLLGNRRVTTQIILLLHWIKLLVDIQWNADQIQLLSR